MREIKFRAWDIDLKEMIYGEDLIKMCIMISPANGNLINYKEPWVYLKDKYILMQYTGLKDKNGKEVYEGDIFEINYFNLDKEEVYTKGEVFFEKGAFVCKGIKGIHFSNGNIEVIGNIYENKDLLEV